MNSEEDMEGDVERKCDNKSVRNGRVGRERLGRRKTAK